MATYSTPGVYVEEISTFPPSVAEVSTAIPAFIGYTETGATSTDEPLVMRISNLLEYETHFGGPKKSTYTGEALLDDDTSTWSLTSLSRSAPASGEDYILYYAVSLYFKNGGGPCYIISVGSYDDTITAASRFNAGLDALEKEDEPTLILFPDAAVNLSSSIYYLLCQDALAQCNKLGDRFAIIDAVELGSSAATGDTIESVLRDELASDYLRYGAAYTPYLNTSLVYATDDSTVTITMSSSSGTATTSSTTTEEPEEGTTTSSSSTSGSTLDQVQSASTAVYSLVVKALAEQYITLPPSAAMAGVYARVDRDRGVWKAPANVALASVISPASKITDEGQSTLNIDANSGKSINAIRAFTGKGTLVWGARTLAGNDNEWRYVSVRRLFNMIEESSQKATAFAVFEPNDATTWLKVKAMIESFLFSLWEKGALQGSKPDAAYYVNVGLGKTMTAQDILEGRLIVEIGVAAVRPAEFIILRFSHKLAEV